MRSLTGPSESPRNLRMKEFFEQEAGEAAAVVADDGMLLEEIIEDDAEAELLESGEIDGDRFGALGTIAPGYIGRDGAAIGDDPIDNAMWDVLLNGAKVIGECVAGGFTGQIGRASCRERV